MPKVTRELVTAFHDVYPQLEMILATMKDLAKKRPNDAVIQPRPRAARAMPLCRVRESLPAVVLTGLSHCPPFRRAQQLRPTAVLTRGKAMPETSLRR